MQMCLIRGRETEIMEWSHPNRTVVLMFSNLSAGRGKLIIIIEDISALWEYFDIKGFQSRENGFFVS